MEQTYGEGSDHLEGDQEEEEVIEEEKEEKVEEK